MKKETTITIGRAVTYATVDHPRRTESATYRASRAALAAIIATVKPWMFGEGPYDAHHGGGLWLHDDAGWFFVRNLVGIEWSAQFCSDPKRVDLLRQNARRLYAGFPSSFPAFKKLGIELRPLLERRIATARDVARWTDSICNASVPLPSPLHIGVLPEGAGVHHYPTPVLDIDRVRRRDFHLWVRDAEGMPAAVVPMSRPGHARDGRVTVLHATPGTRLHARHVAAMKKGHALVLPATHRLARAARGE